MQSNPAEEWRNLTETYRAMFDGELENLAEEMDNLTETAREVLRAEMKLRGLAMPGEIPVSQRPDLVEAPDAEGSPSEFTWKTKLANCNGAEEARQFSEVLRRAGIESWVTRLGAQGDAPLGDLGSGDLQISVAADQLDQALEILRQPIPQEIIDESQVEIPEYELPRCPSCGDDDPVLESAEPSNSWLCEACGHAWTETVEAPGGRA